MENSEIVILNLSSICRACLVEGDNMKDLLVGQETLLGIFTEVASIEVDKSDPLPSLLCGQCQHKLIMSHDFKQQCQRSNDILKQYIINEQNEEAKLAEVKTNAFMENNGFEDSSDYDPNEETEKNVVSNKQTLRLTQYSYDAVTQAIEESKKKFLENTECIKCGFVGSNSRALSVHVSHLHKDMKETWCSQCNSEFTNLEEHLKSHGNKGLTCQFCGKVFNAKGHLTEHLRCHTGARPFKCEICAKAFKTSRHLRVHFRVHTKEKPFKCKVCLKTFKEEQSRKIHEKNCENRVVSNQPFMDDNDGCETNSKDEESIKRVLAQNFCAICNRKVRSLGVHNRNVHKPIDHEESHNSTESKLCTVCGKQFKTISKLTVHMRIHTGETPYRCTYCDKRVTTRTQLVVHLRTHTGEKPHVCHICGKGFAQSSVLNTHMKLHTGRTEVCTICEQRFCRPAELKLHMRKHTGEKPYLCTQCGQAFIQKSHLMEHFKTHSDDRPYQCSYCDKAFKQNSSLKSHIQIHLGTKPYRCSQCTYACRQSYSLTKHMAQHSNDAPRLDRPHICETCQKSFTTMAMLNFHTSTIHSSVVS